MENFFGVDDTAVFTDTNEEVYLFAGFGAVNVPAEVFWKFVGVDHDGRLLDRASPEEHIKDGFGASRKEFFTNAFSTFIDEMALRAENNNGGMLLECF